MALTKNVADRIHQVTDAFTLRAAIPRTSGRLWAHDDELHVVRHPWDYEHEQPRIKYALRYPRFVAIFTAMGAQGALFVKGADTVETYGSQGELDVPGKPRIVFTPGHTYGHCSLHFPDRGTLDCGRRDRDTQPVHGSQRSADRLGRSHCRQRDASALAVAAVNRAREAGPS